MAPRKSDGSIATNNMSPSRAATTLRHLRTQIDKLDLQLLKLLNDRATIAAEIGRLKNDHGEEVFSPAREQEVIKNILDVHAQHKSSLDPNTVPAVYRELI